MSRFVCLRICMSQCKHFCLNNNVSTSITNISLQVQAYRLISQQNHYHHHVLHVGHLGHCQHVPHVGQLLIIAHAQCYCFLSILYNSGLIGQLSSSRYARRQIGSLSSRSSCRSTTHHSACVMLLFSIYLI